MKIPRNLRDVIEKHGCAIEEIRRNKHLVMRLRLPDGRMRTMVAALSLSDNYRGLKNFESDLKKEINSPGETTT